MLLTFYHNEGAKQGFLTQDRKRIATYQPGAQLRRVGWFRPITEKHLQILFRLNPLMGHNQPTRFKDNCQLGDILKFQPSFQES